MKALECDSRYQQTLALIRKHSRAANPLPKASLSELKGGTTGIILTENQIRDIKQRQYLESKARREEQQMLRVSGIAPKRRNTRKNAKANN